MVAAHTQQTPIRQWVDCTMDQLGLIAAVILATAILIPLSNRINLPWPVLVTVFGIVLAAIPPVPQVRVEPDLILPIVLPPLLYATARRTSWRQWAANTTPILLLAVALVFVTTAAVAFVASHFVPGISIAGAVALGALVSPPDPVAASAIAAKLHLPRRLVSMLEGEGLFNDVAALVLYQVAIGAVVGGSFSPGNAAVKLLLAAVLALVTGFVFGWGITKLIALLGSADPRPPVLISILAPTAVYVAAEEIHGSGVLAVLVYTLYSVSQPVDASDATGRMTTDIFWSMTETLVTSIAFGLVGLEFQTAFQALDAPWTSLVGETAAVVGAVVLVRLLYLLPSVLLGRRLYRRLQVGALDDALSGQHGSRRLERQRHADVPIGWRETVGVWWAGMRGVATVALALALPETTDAGGAFPARDRSPVHRLQPARRSTISTTVETSARESATAWRHFLQTSRFGCARNGLTTRSTASLRRSPTTVNSSSPACNACSPRLATNCWSRDPSVVSIRNSSIISSDGSTSIASRRPSRSDVRHRSPTSEGLRRRPRRPGARSGESSPSVCHRRDVPTSSTGGPGERPERRPQTLNLRPVLKR